MKTLLIYNLNSGKGKIKNDLSVIEDFFKLNAWDLDLLEVKPNMNLKSEVSTCAANYEVILIAGGDGTIHNVLNGLMAISRDLRPKVMFLPYGTTNDASSMIGMSKNIKDSLNLLHRDTIKYMDITQANDNYFVYAAAVGKFSKVSYEIDRRTLKFLGPLGYFINTLSDLFNSYKMDVEVKYEDKTIRKKAFLVIIASGTKVAGFNLSKFSKIYKIDSGLIGIRIFTRNHFLSWMKMVWFYLFKGRHFKNDIHLDVSSALISLPNNYIWNIDGEKGPSGSLHVKTLKSELKVYVNNSKKSSFFNYI